MTLSTPIVNAAAAAVAALLFLAGTLQAATPEAVPADDIAIERLDLDGEVYSLSPDGQWLVGMDDDDHFCRWKADTFEAMCGDEPMPILPTSFAWAPDSSAVAWSLDAIVNLYESDLYVHEIATNTTTNITDDGVVGGLFGVDVANAGSLSVDLMPAWSHDGQTLTFARTTSTNGSFAGTQLMTIPRGGGEPESLGIVSTDPFAVWSPMIRTMDDALIFTLWSADPDDAARGVWLLADGATPEKVLDGAAGSEFPMPVVVATTTGDVGTLVSGYGRTEDGELKPFLLLVDAGVAGPMTEEIAGVPLGPVGFSPDGELAVARSLDPAQSKLVFFDLDGNVSTLPVEEPQFDAGAHLLMPPMWASNDTILLLDGRGGGFLATLPADGVPRPSTPTPMPDCGCVDPESSQG